MLNKLKLKIPVFASLLKSEARPMVDDLLLELRTKFKTMNVEPEFHIYTKPHIVPSDFPALHRSAQYNLCFIATGGTESLCVEYASLLHKRAPEKPIILLSHPYMNSLAAGLEARCKLVYETKPAYLFHTTDHQEMQNLFSVLRARDYLTQEGKKVGIIGHPSDWLVASDLETIGSKSEVWGIKIHEEIISLKEVTKLYDSIPNNSSEVENIVRYFLAQDAKLAATRPGDSTNRWLWDNARFCVALSKVVKQYDLFGLTLRCFDLINGNITGCLAVSYLNDMGIPSACEGDIPALITMMLSHSVSGSPSFMANPIHYRGKHLTLAHCTIPTKMTMHVKLMTHFESGQGAAIQADLRNPDKPWTISRANLWDNVMNCEEVIARNIEAKSDRSCRTQVEAEFKSEELLLKYLGKASGNHQILTEGSWVKTFQLYKKLFIH